MKRIISFIFLVISINTFSQVEGGLFPKFKKQASDTTRIKDLSGNLALWIYAINKQSTLGLQNTTEKKTLEIRPNEQVNIGFGFNYKWMGLGIAFKPPFSSNDDDVYGKTSRLDLQLNIFAKSFGIDLTAQYYKGYYVSNPQSIIKWEKREYPQLEDLETVNIELSTYYFSNHKKFSYRAAFVRNEIQLKGAGSPIFGLYYRLSAAGTNNKGIIPEEFEDIKSRFDVYGYVGHNYGISIGYTYTFVIWKKIFVNFTFVPGLGGQAMRIYTKEENARAGNKLAVRVLFRSAIGYEHKYFYLGLSNLNITNEINYEDVSIFTSSTKFRIYVGKRFNLKKKK